jgi:hypothetical protein
MKYTLVFTEDFAGKKKGDTFTTSHQLAHSLIQKGVAVKEGEQPVKKQAPKTDTPETTSKPETKKKR